MEQKLIRKNLLNTEYFPEIKYDLQFIYIGGLAILEDLLNRLEKECPPKNGDICRKMEKEVNTCNNSIGSEIGNHVEKFHNLFKRLFFIWHEFWSPGVLDEAITESQISSLLAAYFLLSSDENFEFDDSNLVKMNLKHGYSNKK